MAPTCFGLRPSSGSLQLSLAEFILTLKYSVSLRRNLLCSGVAACLSVARVLCAVLCRAHNTHATLRHGATPLHNKPRRKLTECFNINITLARLNCKLPDDGHRPKHVGAI
jgi:hypothetical protein